MREQMLVTKPPPSKPAINDTESRRQEMLQLRENYFVKQRAQMARYQDLVEHRRKVVPPPCFLGRGAGSPTPDRQKGRPDGGRPTLGNALMNFL
ncbi:hypothetical protein CDD81_6467 [Ophiocordyceps australis]|uniref:Uncharacterized protein n=1 Tax=Ophiocordyceps australis TaxID=1399860 RepID=A0A2C5YGL8_9HYPO|nr:hypothetical protein CDD81_6467 [Ophiocordyceps australis]